MIYNKCKLIIIPLLFAKYYFKSHENKSEYEQGHSFVPVAYVAYLYLHVYRVAQ